MAAIATSRGVDLGTLQAKILANVADYELASGTILGMQQAYEDMIAAAETVSEVQAISVEFSLPTQ
jgi:biotin synthase-like enzyme